MNIKGDQIISTKAHCMDKIEFVLKEECADSEDYVLVSRAVQVDIDLIMCHELALSFICDTS